jgi:hypothetical protein
MTVKLKPKVVFCLCFGGAHTAVGWADETPNKMSLRNIFMFVAIRLFVSWP